MAISWPNNIDAGKVVNNYVSATDILPTLANIVGIEISDIAIDGIDLLKPEENRLLVWKWQKTWAVRKGDWKLTNTNENHWKSEPSAQYIAPIADNMELKLFNIAKDPGERIDLATQNPEKVIELEAAYKNWIELNVRK